MKRVFAYRGGKLTEITSGRTLEIRHSDDNRIVENGSMAERVLLGFKREEQTHGSALFQKLPFSANHIKRVWSE